MPLILGWREVEVDGRDSFHPQNPMDRAMQGMGGGMEEGCKKSE
jgi:hypothetical protein